MARASIVTVRTHRWCAGPGTLEHDWDMTPRERVLTCLALGEDPRVAIEPSQRLELHPVDARDAALVRLGAMLALDAPTATLQRTVAEAQLAGVSDDEIVHCLVSLVPMLGSARTTSVAPHLALAMGFDVDEALERR